jgi:hypothetical protein
MAFRWLACFVSTLFAAVALAQTTETTTAPVIAVDQMTPRGALKLYLTADARSDGEALRQVLIGDDEAQKAMILVIAGRKDADRKLTAALAAKFPEQWTTDPKAAADAALARELPAVDRVAEKIDRDTATLQGPGAADRPFTLRRIDGKWCIPLAVLKQDVDPATLERDRQAIGAEIQVMQTAGDDVAAGKYASLKEAVDAIKNQLLQAALKAQTQPAA